MSIREMRDCQRSLLTYVPPQGMHFHCTDAHDPRHAWNGYYPGDCAGSRTVARLLGPFGGLHISTTWRRRQPKNALRAPRYTARSVAGCKVKGTGRSLPIRVEMS